MPPHQRLRLENCNDLQDRRKPSIHLEEEPAIVVGKPGPDGHLAPQKDQLMSERSILSLKPALRLEWRGQHGQNKSKSVRTSRQFSRFYHSINPDRIFGTHRHSVLEQLTIIGLDRSPRSRWRKTDHRSICRIANKIKIIGASRLKQTPSTSAVRSPEPWGRINAVEMVPPPAASPAHRWRGYPQAGGIETRASTVPHPCYAVGFT
jgi:hypothetical protein